MTGKHLIRLLLGKVVYIVVNSRVFGIETDLSPCTAI